MGEAIELWLNAHENERLKFAAGYIIILLAFIYDIAVHGYLIEASFIGGLLALLGLACLSFGLISYYRTPADYGGGPDDD